MGVIRRTATSRKDYAAIWDYVAADNPDAADALLRSFDAALQMLSDHPHAGPRRPELRPRLRSFPVGNYLIIYRPMRGGVELLRVLHGARDVRRVFNR
jgi:toxin ParE1/3/4